MRKENGVKYYIRLLRVNNSHLTKKNQRKVDRSEQGAENVEEEKSKAIQTCISSETVFFFILNYFILMKLFYFLYRTYTGVVRAVIISAEPLKKKNLDVISNAIVDLAGINKTVSTHARTMYHMILSRCIFFVIFINFYFNFTSYLP